jgi:glyoxylase I family protein
VHTLRAPQGEGLKNAGHAPAFPIWKPTMKISGIHHIAIIASDYERSKRFYTEVLGLRVLAEVYREARDSWKLDLQVSDGVQIELFSFPSPPPRVSRPEACGLRHLAFVVPDIEQAIASLQNHSVEVEAVRVDEYTGKRFTFFADPDGLPLELYEV